MTDAEWFTLRSGARMPFMVFGSDDERTVVALPGLSDGLLPLSEPHARQALKILADLPFQLVLLSYAHPLGEGITTRQLSRDAAEFLRSRRSRPVAVLGHSMGGMVAQHLAAEHPDLVSRLVLTATLAAPEPSFVAHLERWDRLVVNEEWRAFSREAITTSYTGSEVLRRRIALRVLGPHPAPHLASRHHALTQACLSHDSRAVLTDIQAPTLVLAGAEDPVVAPAAALRLAEEIPAAKFEVFEHASHGFPEQFPHRTFGAVAGHLGLDPNLSRRLLGRSRL